MILFPSSRRALKFAGCGAFAALAMGLASAHAQTVPPTAYSTDFNNTTTFPTGASIDAEDGWDDSDKIAYPDSVGIVGGFSATGTDQAVEFGGAFIGSSGGPSTSPVYISHGFAPVGNYALNTDFLLTASAFPNANNNTYGFTFRTGLGTTLSPYTNLFSVTFAPQNSTNPGGTTQALNIQSTTYTSGVANAPANVGTTNAAVFLGQRYHLTTAVNITTDVLTITLTAETTNFTTGVITNGASNSFNVTLPATDAVGVTNVAATYLATPNNTPGTNSIIFDNFSVVPEPSTYAMLGLGLLGLAVRFRRKARA